MTLTPTSTQPFFQFISFVADGSTDGLTAQVNDAEGNALDSELQPTVQIDGQTVRLLFPMINRLPNPVCCIINQDDVPIWNGSFERQRNDRRSNPWVVTTN